MRPAPGRMIRGVVRPEEPDPWGVGCTFVIRTISQWLRKSRKPGLARLKRLVDDQGLPWDYAPLHRHLRLASEDGTSPFFYRSCSTALLKILAGAVGIGFGGRGSRDVVCFMS